jgi:molecular chaperone DnaK (HSP70)
MLKRKFNPGHDERSRLQLSYLGEELSAKKLKDLINVYNETHEEALHLKQRGASSIDLPPDLMASFFADLFEKIKSKVKELVDQSTEKHPTGVDFIFMVGGFSESPYLKTVIKEAFEVGNLTVLVPRRPQVSVI